MIRKQNLWFLTLFSLILVLSVYYITMPNDLLLDKVSKSDNTNQEYNDFIRDFHTLSVETEPQNFNNITLNDLSVDTGISVKTLNRFLGYEDFSDIASQIKFK